MRFGDPLRPEVAAAVDAATTAGIQTMMVTGSHLDTAISPSPAPVGLLARNGDGITGWIWSVSPPRNRRCPTCD